MELGSYMCLEGWLPVLPSQVPCLKIVQMFFCIVAQLPLGALQILWDFSSPGIVEGKCR